MKTLVFIAAIGVAGPLLAQAQPRNADRNNPNAVVCRIVTDTGSRLDRVRTCKTRAQWAEDRRDSRDSDRPQNPPSERRDSN